MEIDRERFEVSQVANGIATVKYFVDGKFVCLMRAVNPTDSQIEAMKNGCIYNDAQKQISGLNKSMISHPEEYSGAAETLSYDQYAARWGKQRLQTLLSRSDIESHEFRQKDGVTYVDVKFKKVAIKNPSPSQSPP